MYKKPNSISGQFINLNKCSKNLRQQNPLLQFQFNLIIILVITTNKLMSTANGMASPIVFHQTFELVIEPEPEPDRGSRPSWLNGICVNITEIETGTFQALGCGEFSAAAPFCKIIAGDKQLPFPLCCDWADCPANLSSEMIAAGNSKAIIVADRIRITKN